MYVPALATVLALIPIFLESIIVLTLPLIKMDSLEHAHWQGEHLIQVRLCSQVQPVIY